MNDMLHKQRLTPGMHIAAFLICFGLSLVLSTGVQFLILQAFHIDPLMVGSIKNVTVLRLLQVTGSVILMALPAMAYAWLISAKPRKPFSTLGFNRMASGKQVFLLVLMVIPAMLMSGSLAEITRRIPLTPELGSYFKMMEDKYSEQVMVLARMDNVLDLIVSILLLALIPAIVEEMLFRGGLQNMLKNINAKPVVAIVVTALLFSLIHFSFYGFLSRLFLGLLLGFVFEWSRNLWLCIFFHFLNNAFILIQVYVTAGPGGINEEALNTTTPVFYALLTLPLLYMFGVVFFRESRVVHSRFILDAELKRMQDEHQQENEN